MSYQWRARVGRVLAARIALHAHALAAFGSAQFPHLMCPRSFRCAKIASPKQVSRAMRRVPHRKQPAPDRRARIPRLWRECGSRMLDSAKKPQAADPRGELRQGRRRRTFQSWLRLPKALEKARRFCGYGGSEEPPKDAAAGQPVVRPPRSLAAVKGPPWWPEAAQNRGSWRRDLVAFMPGATLTLVLRRRTIRSRLHLRVTGDRSPLAVFQSAREQGDSGTSTTACHIRYIVGIPERGQRNFLGCRPMFAKLGPSPVEFAQIWPTPGRTSSGSNARRRAETDRVEFGHNMLNLRAHLKLLPLGIDQLGRLRSIWSRARPQSANSVEAANIGPSSAGIPPGTDQNWHELDHTWRDFDKHCSEIC